MFTSIAQRRPGLSPRRHALITTTTPPVHTHAQRRPGLSPRRHCILPNRCNSVSPRALNEGRGSHPGDTCPAGVRKSAGRRSLNEGRGSHPGDTRARSAGLLAHYSTLNEGRGSHPGDTFSTSACSISTPTAQRRPGLSPRRHLCLPSSPLGRTASAQRRPGLSPRRHSNAWPHSEQSGPRSTKAGALTPATPVPARYRDSRGFSPLNEGRGSHPGDTPSCRVSSSSYLRTAQRRPGLSPRRHWRSRSPASR